MYADDTDNSSKGRADRQEDGFAHAGFTTILQLNFSTYLDYPEDFPTWLMSASCMIISLHLVQMHV